MSERKIYIFGAHSRAQTLAAYLEYLYQDVSIEAFLYDDMDKNPEQIGDTAVIKWDTETYIHTEYPVYIATRGIYHEGIRRKLEGMGVRTVIPVTYELDKDLRNNYLQKYFSAKGLEFPKIDRLGGLAEIEAAIYVARAISDCRLHSKYILAPYEKEIQVGAALTEERIASGILTDDTGDNISVRNRQFCELTALYWIWKNAKEDIVGLVHYRRHFILPPDWLERMMVNGVDVILPVPLHVAPNLRDNFRKRHDSEDWDYMMAYLKGRDGKEAQEAEDFFRTNLYSPCNMFIMRREVLDELCGWLFPILFAVAGHSGTKDDSYGNRYPGFLSERLISFFFEKNRDRYNMVYSDKNFLD